MLFEGMFAFQQMVVLMAGLSTGGLGVLCIGGHFYTVAKSEKISVAISGVRVEKKTAKSGRTNDMYYAQIEYVAPNGELVQAESTSGSSSLAGKVPGRKIIALINPDKPHEFTRRGIWLLLFGGMLFLMGVGLCYFALVHFEFTRFSALAGLVFIGWRAVKLKRNIKPRDQWETAKKFMSRKSGALLEGREALPLLDKTEVKKRLKESSKNFVKWMPLTILIALFFCGGGWYFSLALTEMLEKGTRVPGHVVRMESNCDSEGCTYFPIVKFKDRQGETQQFKEGMGSNPPTYSTGEDVTVLYRESGHAKPMIDRGIWNWMLPGALGGVGLLIILVVLIQYFGIVKRRKQQ